MPARKSQQPAPRMDVINLEAGMPTVPQALSRLSDVLRNAKRDGAALVKIIHGWGSTGVGGALRLAVQRELAQMAGSSELRAFIAGEDWRISNESAWELLHAYPSLKNAPDFGRGNKGISIVWL